MVRHFSLLKWRPAEPHCDFVGAVLRANFTHLMSAGQCRKNISAKKRRNHAGSWRSYQLYKELLKDPWQTEGGGVTEDLLRALRIPFSYLDNVGHVAARIAKAQTLSLSANKPVALLLCRDLMWEEN